MGFHSYWVQTPPPYIYEGPRLIETHLIESNKHVFTFYLTNPKPLFKPPFCCSSVISITIDDVLGLLVDLGQVW